MIGRDGVVSGGGPDTTTSTEWSKTDKIDHTDIEKGNKKEPNWHCAVI